MYRRDAVILSTRISKVNASSNKVQDGICKRDETAISKIHVKFIRYSKTKIVLNVFRYQYTVNDNGVYCYIYRKNT